MPEPKRKLITGFVLLMLSLLGAAAFRRRGGSRSDRVDLYYADGSMASLAAGSADGDRLLAAARAVLREARA